MYSPRVRRMKSLFCVASNVFEVEVVSSGQHGLYQNNHLQTFQGPTTDFAMTRSAQIQSYQSRIIKVINFLGIE